MMIQAMRDFDYIIVVLTESYAKKANEFQGGVGFESELLLSDLRRNKDKIILIMRHQGDYESVFPYHLRDYYAIDFSNDTEFEVKLEELIRRVYRANPYQKAPLGEKPNFDVFGTASKKQTTSSIFADIKVPNLKKFTDLEKEEYLFTSYHDMKVLFEELFNHIASSYSNFRYTFDEESNKKCMFKLYVDGEVKTGVKMWVESLSSFHAPYINLSYGAHSTFGSGVNEIIYNEVRDERLSLRMTMNTSGSDDATTPEKFVRSVWEDHLKHSLKM